jgi:hypothetical protein
MVYNLHDPTGLVNFLTANIYIKSFIESSRCSPESHFKYGGKLTVKLFLCVCLNTSWIYHLLIIINKKIKIDI